MTSNNQVLGVSFEDALNELRESVRARVSCEFACDNPHWWFGKYQAIRNEEERREANRERQASHRKKTSKKNGMKSHGSDTSLPGEKAYAKAEANGATSEQLDDIVTSNLPESARNQSP